MARAATTSDAFNAVAEPRRREILRELALTELSVGELVIRLGMRQPSVSKHLRVLRNVGLVRVRRAGRHVLYQTNAEAIRPLHEWVKMFDTHSPQFGSCSADHAAAHAPCRTDGLDFVPVSQTGKDRQRISRGRRFPGRG